MRYKPGDEEQEMTDQNPDKRLWSRAFQICAEKGWDANNILNWCSAISIARKESEK